MKKKHDEKTFNSFSCSLNHEKDTYRVKFYLFFRLIKPYEKYIIKNTFISLSRSLNLEGDIKKKSEGEGVYH
jgi:hypothetical protein